MLEPPAIRAAEFAGDNTARLTFQEEARALPFGVVWNFCCESNGVPVSDAWLTEVRKHAPNILTNRR